ncbi:putative bifunctional diguanylate cyclase/phosphodiesterase [Halalkalibacter urbisdiaboli]|uniref:putative bifunctional diguanylate cyclase/phosphodiesterase n=1 Tax=Halalkalibacter urbisdiaboli TaxID=1960589 RepID=UPI000B430A4D|nr:EAL domain-containing protein [Halalkalibacter urbisdiaboli]
MTRMNFRTVAHDILQLLNRTLQATHIYITKKDGNRFRFLYGICEMNTIHYTHAKNLFENEVDMLQFIWSEEEYEEREIIASTDRGQLISKPLYLSNKEMFGTLTIVYPATEEVTDTHRLVIKTMVKFLNYALELRSIAISDSLTGLYNRYFLETYLSKTDDILAKGYAIIYFDLDDFKYVNDSLGHNTGDKILRYVSQKLKKNFADFFVCRMGGDEFLIFLPWVTEQEVLEKFAKRIYSMFKKPYLVDGFEIFLKASVGISIYPDDASTLEDMIKNADAAMYVAKEKGKNQAVFYNNGMNEGALKRLELESYLNKALEYDEFELYYQPQIEVSTNRLIGVEALIRWNHPKLGVVSPQVFLDIAEKTNLIIPIGEWVIRTACSTLKQWLDSGHPEIRMSVNLSAKQFLQHGLSDIIAQILEETNLPAHLLNLEITETVSVNDAKVVISILDQLKSLGLEISVDDFGTGYSSLAYLKDFPVDCLKIDQMFIREIEKDPKHKAIVNATIYLAHALNLRVVGEAVETKEQLEFLEQMGCDEVQGYFYSKPLPYQKMIHLLEKYRQEGKFTTE